MLVSESKNKDAVVRIYDDYFENEPEQILDKLSEIVSAAYRRIEQQNEENWMKIGLV